MPSSQSIYDAWDRQEQEELERRGARLGVPANQVRKLDQLNQDYMEGEKLYAKKKREEELILFYLTNKDRDLEDLL